jgi:hypothetical protein
MRFIAFVFLLPFLGACSDSGTPVHYVFPTGFSGHFVITRGTSDSGGYTYDGTQHVYTFPENGVLSVRSTRPLEQWHTVTAALDDGTAIPWGEFETMNSEQIRFINLGATSDGEHFGAVGTQEQVESLRQQWNRGDLQRTTR